MTEFNVLVLGCLIGLTLSYTGVAAFMLGMFSGIILQCSYPSLGNTVWNIANDMTGRLHAITKKTQSDVCVNADDHSARSNHSVTPVNDDSE